MEKQPEETPALSAFDRLPSQKILTTMHITLTELVLFQSSSLNHGRSSIPSLDFGRSTQKLVA
jgi:hypothetical protein